MFSELRVTKPWCPCIEHLETHSFSKELKIDRKRDNGVITEIYHLLTEKRAQGFLFSCTSRRTRGARGDEGSGRDDLGGLIKRHGETTMPASWTTMLCQLTEDRWPISWPPHQQAPTGHRNRCQVTGETHTSNTVAYCCFLHSCVGQRRVSIVAEETQRLRLHQSVTFAIQRNGSSADYRPIRYK